MPVFKALFQSVTLRTAGFNTVDLNAMKQASVMIMIILMLIGGSPGSTAGGMKTTTFAVLMGNMVATFKRNKNIHFFERRRRSRRSGDHFDPGSIDQPGTDF